MTTNYVRVFLHNGNIYLNPRHILESQVEQYIKDWKESIFQEAKRIAADHFIYATKTYADNVLDRLDLYQVALDDEDFTRRTDALLATGDHMILAWHKGTAY